ncbi:MAG TPA: ABC-ATPase UvrA [Candidatus Magasanikbacteria bacterium]|nr:ABC-ATPase UvrA [Candidatus Magasanikbacteria bacterium]
MQEKIIIRGAREHNLKNISLELPRNKMIVFTGLSGSGKSSLAFDTIFAEGQRRYIESLSAYARQFLGGMQKPDVDEIEGLSPAISIDQKAHSANPRSTVATITEIYDYLRVLFARIGEPHCPLCNTKIEKMTIDQMQERIMESVNKIRTTKNTKLRTTNHELIILAPVVRGRKGEYYQMLYDVYNSGFLEVRVDGKMKSLKNRIELSKDKKHTIEVVIDKLQISDFRIQNSDGEKRLAEAVETAVDLSNGLCTVIYPNDEACPTKLQRSREQIFSTEYSCPKDGFSFPEIEPRLFSFNSPYGYCDYCTGLGTKSLFSEDVCPKCEGKRLNANALSVKIFGKNIWEVVSMDIGEVREFFAEVILNLPEREQEIAGAVLREIENRLQFMYDVGLHYLTLNRTAGTLSGGEAQRIRLASQVGTKLVGALYVLDEPTIGLHQKDNDQLVRTLRNLCDVGNTIIVVEHDEDTILASDWIVDIGPGAGTHGGEIVYSGPLQFILNPEQQRMGEGSFEGKVYGGTKNISSLINVGSERSFIRPVGLIQDELKNCLKIGDPKKSLTGQYLRREKNIEAPEKRRKVDNTTAKIKIKGASEHNLKNINVEIPLRRFVCLTGVSGSGKSTLMHDILYRTVSNRLNYHGHAPEEKKKKVGDHKQVLNTEYIDKIIKIDQSAIGRSPRSNPATYTGTWTHIRDLYASTPEAKMRGYKNGRFSFNRPGGRCDNCEGRGTLEIEMHFLPSVEIVCDVCKGKRFNNETLQIHYKEKNISDVLNMTIEEAESFFEDIPFIYDKLKVLNEVGLDYLTLGQSAKTLSGGEAQRIKLSRELAKPSTTKTLFLLDEPTTGLHYEDVKKLIGVLQELVSKGNTVMVIEHNLDVIKCADWIIDLGPEGGDKGGEVVCVGTPETVAKIGYSYTGQYLKKIL